MRPNSHEEMQSERFYAVVVAITLSLKLIVEDVRLFLICAFVSCAYLLFVLLAEKFQQNISKYWLITGSFLLSVATLSVVWHLMPLWRYAAGISALLMIFYILSISGICGGLRADSNSHQIITFSASRRARASACGSAPSQRLGAAGW